MYNANNIKTPLTDNNILSKYRTSLFGGRGVESLERLNLECGIKK